MSVSLKTLPKITHLFNTKDTFNLSQKKSIKKSNKYINIKKVFCEEQKPQKKEKKINKNLSILNFISRGLYEKSSVRANLSDTIPEKFDYSLFMINKYEENLDLSLSFISEFDLEEEDNKNYMNESFKSSDNEDNCEEQIEIKTITKKITSYDEEDNIKWKKEWNEISELLLRKESSQ